MANQQGQMTMFWNLIFYLIYWIQLCDKKNLTFIDCCGKISLTLSQTSPVFTCLQYKSFENAVGKGEIARNKQFLLFPQCFLPVWITLCHFHQNKNSHQQTLSVWKSLKSGVWERVKLVLKNVIRLAKGSHNNIFQESLNRILSQQ